MPSAIIDLETQLSSLWGDILSIPPPGPDEDFFTLGGDSRKATRLFIAIEKRFGLKLPRALLLVNNTIRKLAALILADPGLRKQFLVALRPQGAKKPLFLIPGGYGDVFYLGSLLKYLDPERPLYGLQAPAPDSGSSYDTRVEQIAAAYLAELLQVQPEGPYHLAGHSFGGLVAMEMARLLLAQDHQVAFLGVLDTYPPGPRRQASLPDRIVIHLHNLRGLGPRQLLDYFRDRWISLLLRFSRLAPVRSILKWVNYSPNKKAMLASTIFRYNYNPPPYPGDLCLFVVQSRPWYVRWDPMENWRILVLGHLEIRPVRGEHGNLLFEPHVRDLATQLNDCLGQPPI